MVSSTLATGCFLANAICTCSQTSDSLEYDADNTKSVFMDVQRSTDYKKDLDSLQFYRGRGFWLCFVD